MNEPVPVVKKVFDAYALNKTKYPSCLTCKEQCHGCIVCGFMFTCSKCEPCHEGPDLTKASKALDNYTWDEQEQTEDKNGIKL